MDTKEFKCDYDRTKYISCGSFVVDERLPDGRYYPKEVVEEALAEYKDLKIIREIVTAKSRKLSAKWTVEFDQDFDYVEGNLQKVIEEMKCQN